jgi:translocon-associated protein subunit gamma
LIIGTVVQAIALQFAYKNVKFVSKEKIATARSEAIANEVSAQVGKAINRQELDDRILHRKNEVAENESLHYSIFYNNAIYLAVHMLFSIVFFKNSTPLTNYVISIIMSAGFVAGISNTK